MLEKFKKHVAEHPDGYGIAAGVLVAVGVIYLGSKVLGPRYPFSIADDNVGELLVVDLDALPTKLADALKEHIAESIPA